MAIAYDQHVLPCWMLCRFYPVQCFLCEVKVIMWRDGFTSQNFCPIWLPHWPAWRWTISLILICLDLGKVNSYHNAMIASVKYLHCKSILWITLQWPKMYVTNNNEDAFRESPHLMGPIIRCYWSFYCGKSQFRKPLCKEFTPQ